MARVTTAGQSITTRSFRSRSHGFTLAELVMVIVMIGILAIVVIPSFNAAPFLARGFYDELKSAARHAQKLAVASGCPVRLSTTATSYALKQSADCGATAWDVDVQHPGRSGGYAGSAPSGVTITSSGPVVFQPNGSSNGGSVGAGGSSFSIATTGYVSGD